METNLVLNHTLYVYYTDATDSGDAVALGTAREVPCLLENSEGWETSDFADETTGVITCQIMPDNAFYVSRGGKFNGLLAQFARVGEPGDDDWYRITNVHPGESLVTGDPDLVELQLTRIANPETAEA